MLIEVELKLLVGVVDAQLLKTIFLWINKDLLLTQNITAKRILLSIFSHLLSTSAYLERLEAEYV